MAESGLKEAIEGLDKLRFAVILTLVLAVFIAVAFIVAIFVAASAQSLIPLAVAALLPASFAYPLWLMAGAYGKFHMVFSWRDSYRWAQLVSEVGAGFAVGLSVVFSVWVAAGWDLSPNPLMRILGYFVGLVFAAVYARADMDLGEDTSTIYFKYLAVARFFSALFSFIEALSFVIGLIGLVLFFVAVREAREELLNRMLAGR
jgi:hypothetical protein